MQLSECRQCSLQKKRFWRSKDEKKKCRQGFGESARIRRISGDPSAVAPPVPIPNTEVKRCSPDGSTSLGRARVGRCQSYAPLPGNQEAGLFFARSGRKKEIRNSKFEGFGGRLGQQR